MKILAIRGHNIASLGQPFELALDAGVLADAGLFAICGPTGAGKSTVLDVMCLALFGDTPRLRGKGRVKIGTQRKGVDRRLSDKDPRSLLRDNAAQGYAEVDFRGQDDQRYRARWSVRRARLSPQGALQKSTMSLHNLQTGACLSEHKSKQTLLEIQDKLGLNLDQFCRSVLLAQGEFAAFLRADDTERAELLEKMTGTAIYRELSIACYRKHKEVRDDWDKMSKEQGLFEVWTDEQQSAKKAELAESQHHIAQLQAQEQGLRTQVEMATRGRLLQEQLQAARAQEQAAMAAFSQAAAAREELARWQRAQQLRPIKAQLDAASSQLQQLELALRNLDEQAATRQSALTAAKARMSTCSSQMLAFEETQKQLAPMLAKARVLDAQLEDAKLAEQRAQERAQGSTQELARIDGELRAQQEAALANEAKRASLQTPEFDAMLRALGQRDAIYAALDALVEAAKQHEQRCQDLQRSQRAQTSAADELAKVTSQLDALGPPGQKPEHSAAAQLQTQVDACSDTLLGCNHALAALTNLTQLLVQVDSALKKRSSQHQEQARLAQRGVSLEQTRQELRHASSAADLAWSQARAHEQLRDLRVRLQEGDPCPLCGATEHAQATHPDEPDDRTRKQLQDQAQALLAALAQADKDALVAQTTQERLAREIEQAKLQDGQLWRSVGQQYERLVESSASLPAGTLVQAVPDSPCPAWTQDQLARLADAARTMQDKIADLEALKLRVRDKLQADHAASAQRQVVERKVHELGQRRQEALERSSKAGQELAQATASLQVIQDRLQGGMERLRTMLTGRANPLPNLSLSTSLARAKALRTELRTELDALEHAKAELVSLQRQGQELQARGNALATARAVAQSQCQSDIQVQLGCKKERGRLQAARERLLEGRSVRTQSQQIDEDKQRLEKAQDAAQRDQASAERSWLEHQAKAQAMREQRATLGDQMTQLRTQWESALQDGHWTKAQAEIALAVEDARIEQRIEQMATLEARQRESTTLAKARAEDLRKHEQQWPQHDEPGLLNQQLSKLQAQLTQVLADRAALVHACTRDEQQRNARSQHGEQLLAQEARLAQWGQLAELIAHNEGHTFQRFAQGLTMDRLVALSNRQLAEIDQRFRLARVDGGGLDLQVVDTLMGDQVRSVHSLSGGESFLVSLALALALSSLRSSCTRIESLFIDEGFGTLDRESLDQVIAALDALQASGRQIGLISHVEGLAEQLDAQVHIRPCGQGESRVELAGPGLGRI